ncbi:MAG: hypothetical protein ACJAZS_000760 [Alteromonas naphthalenivorans]|jgi:hypothetical protein
MKMKLFFLFACVAIFLNAADESVKSKPSSPNNALEFVIQRQPSTFSVADMQREEDVKVLTKKVEKLTTQVENLNAIVTACIEKNNTIDITDINVEDLSSALLVLPRFRDVVGILGANKYRSDKVVLKPRRWWQCYKKRRGSADLGDLVDGITESNTSRRGYLSVHSSDSQMVLPVPMKQLSDSMSDLDYNYSRSISKDGKRKVSPAGGKSHSSFDAMAIGVVPFSVVSLVSDDEGDE